MVYAMQCNLIKECKLNDGMINLYYTHSIQGPIAVH